MFSPVYFPIFIPIFSLCFNIFIQVFSYKYILRKRLLLSEYLGYACGLILLFIFHFGISGALFFVNLIIYACFSYCYFNFINMGETARRIRILRELYDSPAGLSKEEIFRCYSARDILLIRINRLTNNGQIILRDCKYHIASPVMLLISRAIVLMKLIILGEKSEFDRHD